MTKADLIEAVANETGFAPAQVSRIIESANGKIKSWVANGKTVVFRRFGTFAPVKAAAKQGRNIAKGTVINVPAHYRPKFKPAAEFKARVRKIVA